MASTPHPPPKPAAPPPKQQPKQDDKGPHGTKPSEDQQGAMKDRHPTPRDDQAHRQGEFKDQHVPMKDANDGRTPAVIPTNVTLQPGDDPQEVKKELAQHDFDKVAEEADQIKTVQQEQLERSAEMQAMGIDAWNEKYAPKNPDDDRARSVRGVGPLERRADG